MQGVGYFLVFLIGAVVGIAAIIWTDYVQHDGLNRPWDYEKDGI